MNKAFKELLDTEICVTISEYTKLERLLRRIKYVEYYSASLQEKIRMVLRNVPYGLCVKFSFGRKQNIINFERFGENSLFARYYVFKIPITSQFQKEKTVLDALHKMRFSKRRWYHRIIQHYHKSYQYRKCEDFTDIEVFMCASAKNGASFVLQLAESIKGSTPKRVTIRVIDYEENEALVL